MWTRSRETTSDQNPFPELNRNSGRHHNLPVIKELPDGKAIESRSGDDIVKQGFPEHRPGVESWIGPQHHLLEMTHGLTSSGEAGAL